MGIKTESRAIYFEDNCNIRLDEGRIKKSRLRNWERKLYILWMYKVVSLEQKNQYIEKIVKKL